MPLLCSVVAGSRVSGSSSRSDAVGALEAVGAVSDDLPGVKGPARGEWRLPGCSEDQVALFVVRAGAAGRERQREAGRAPAAAREARRP